MEIRLEQPGDYARVHALETAAFGTSLQAGIVEALRNDADPQLSLVAVLDDDIAGHIFFSPVHIAHRPDVLAAQLSPVAVDPPHQRRGIGSALVREGLARCHGSAWSLVFLLGDPRFYSRFGFILAAPLGFTYGDGKFDEDLQVYEVRSGALDGENGLVHFHPAFDEAGSGR